VTASRGGILFDLFGTLVRCDASILPEITIGGRPIRSTIGRWAGLLAELLPGVELEPFAAALETVSRGFARERAGTHVEHPSRERFRRALEQVGVTAGVAAAVAPALSRAHMRAIVETTRFPEAHAAVLAWAARRGPVGVVTNFDDTATAYQILERHGVLARVQTVVVSEAVGLRKPHPALVTLALRDLGLAPAEALMVGDDVVDDVGAARGAGVDAAWIDAAGTGVPSGVPVPRYVVRGLPELPGIVDAR
jgi:FMN phosphatase YigB (HAD superfamily)